LGGQASHSLLPVVDPCLGDRERPGWSEPIGEEKPPLLYKKYTPNVQFVK
jgi:hypothetical protein